MSDYVVRPKARPYGLILVVGLSLYGVLFIAAVARSFILPPFSDAFALLADEFRAERDHRFALYLWQPHNGHHLVWCRLLTSLDVRLFHGRAVIFAVAAAASLLASAALIGREIWRGLARRSLALLTLTATTMYVLTAINAADCGIPINSVYPITLLFTVAALVLYEGARGGVWRLIAVALAAFAATLGNNVGLAVLPVLVISALLRPDRRYLYPLIVVSVVIGAVILAGAGPLAIGASSVGQAPVARLLKALTYFIAYCGLPWSSAPHLEIAGRVIGLCAALAGVLLVLDSARRRAARGRLERFAHDLILFALITAVMAAAGRFDVEDKVALPIRYAVVAAPLHIGLLIALAHKIEPRWAQGGMAPIGVAALLVAGGLAFQAVGYVVIGQYRDALVQTLNAYVPGRRDPMPTRMLYLIANQTLADATLAEIRRRGLYQPSPP